MRIIKPIIYGMVLAKLVLLGLGIAKASIVDIPFTTLPYLSGLGYGNSNNSSVINNSTHTIHMIIPITHTGNISQIIFRTGTVTVGDTLRINITGVDPFTGISDYIAYSTATVAVGNSDDNKFFTVTMNVSSAVVAGSVICVKISYDSYVAGSMSIEKQSSTTPFVNFYIANFISTIVKGVGIPICYLIYDDGKIYDTLQNSGSGSNASINTTTSPDERGMVFSLPYSVKVCGCGIFINPAQPVNFILYEGTNTVIASYVLSSTSTVSIPGSTGVFVAYFNSEVVLSSGTTYRLSILPTTANNISTYFQVFPSTTAMCGLNNFYLTTRTDGGNWTDTTTSLPSMALIVSGINDVAGSTGTVTTGGGSWTPTRGGSK